MLQFIDVIYRYQSQRFKFDLSLTKGQLVAVLGGSGAGKSTLLNLVAGFIQPESGVIQIAGKNVEKLLPHQRPLSILFQEQNLFSHLSVVDNIAIGLDTRLKLNQAQQKSIRNIATKIGIEKLLSRFPEQLSGGQKQRVALARCFVQKKPLLLLDEAFSALDPILRAEMLAIVKMLAEVNEVTVLMVTHHIADAFSVADSYVFIENGQIINADKIENLNTTTNESVIKYIQASK